MANSAEAKTISTISEFFFEIPPYQRLYEWRKEQIETLLEDIKKALNENRNVYFIGNVVVSKKDDRYILIDGQQRLTTLFLIGVYLASEGQGDWNSFVKSSSNKLRISMPLREDEEKWLSDFIGEQNKDFKNLSKKNPNIHRKITEGLEAIAKWFENNKKNLESISNFLYGTKVQGTQKEIGVRFALVELAEGTDLNQFFVRMNNRGKQLEKHEILKARLLGILQEGDTSGEWKKYAKIWDLCSDMDKYIFQSASDRNILNSSNDGSRNISNASEPSLLNILAKEDVKNNGIDTYENNGVERVKSIIDFPTFLLHVAKLTDDSKDIPINKDKLLDNIVILKSDTQLSDKNNKEKKIFFKDNNKDGVKKFILDILKYRILFDYFVIKRVVDENLSKSGEYSIRRLVEDSKGYFSIGGSVMTELAMLQNYLRVARVGDKQNYHHWLTPFLKKIANINEIQEVLDKVCPPMQKIKTIQIDEQEMIKEDLISFLENLDSDLAYAQMGRKPNEGKGNMDESLLLIAKQYLKGKDRAEWSDEGQVDFQANLNQGTGTPHYWFYRLEYYLWKNKDKLKIDNKDFIFKDIASNYRFRGLNSVEHIWPQSKEGEKGWERRWNDDSNKCYLDDFGNLALISQSFNSSLSDQSIEKKFVDVKERVRDNRVESLKMCLAYTKCKGESSNWTPITAEGHQKEMIRILSDSLKPRKNNSEGYPPPLPKKLK